MSSLPEVSLMRKLSTLSSDKVFLFSDFDVFVLDKKKDKVFRVKGDNIFEISDLATRLKIIFESSVIDESKARKSLGLPTAA